MFYFDIWSCQCHPQMNSFNASGTMNCFYLEDCFITNVKFSLLAFGIILYLQTICIPEKNLFIKNTNSKCHGIAAFSHALISQDVLIIAKQVSSGKKKLIYNNYDEILFYFQCHYRPPMDITKRKQWIEEIKKYQKIDPNFTICHLHFEEEHLRLEKESGKYRLRPNAIPTVFDTKPNQQMFVLLF